MDVVAGEYGWSAMYLSKMMAAEAVDVIQADATRCGGVTGFMDAAAIADAHPIPLSAHCGPTIHMHLGCAARPLRHLEYFHDHVRIESMLFDGFRSAQQDGCMHPDFTRPGLGIELKKKDARDLRGEDLTAMIYDLAQPHYNHAPQFPSQPPNSIEYQQLAVVDGATVERCSFMTHSGSHVDAPFHYLPQLPCIHELPLSSLLRKVRRTRSSRPRAITPNQRRGSSQVRIPHRGRNLRPHQDRMG